MNERALALAARSDRPQDARGVTLTPLARTVDDAGYRYEHVDVRIDRRARSATITVAAPKTPAAEGLDPILAAGASWWPLAMARELDDAILLLRTNELDIGTWILKTDGRRGARARRRRDARCATRPTGSCARSSACCGGRSRGSTSRRARSSR